MYNEYYRKRRRLYEVVECLKEGMSAKQIAEECGMSKRTIERDIKYIREANENK